MNYLKYHSLEEYLFKEVRENFEKRGYLLPEEFFCIVIWKANRAKTRIKRRLLARGKINESVKELTSDICNTQKPEEKLKILMNKWHFLLPMATAILTILYPDDFTIYDIRVRKQLGLKELNSAEKYFSDFLPRVKRFAQKKGLSLRNADKHLWGKSFYEDLKEFAK